MVSALCAAILSVAAPAFAAGSVISAVNFYPSGARFTYEVKSDGRFEFDVPGAFDENSVRCLTLEHMTSVKVERVAVGETEPEELTPYKNRVDETSKALSILEGRRNAIYGAITFLSSPFAGVPYDKDASFDGDGLINYARNAYKLRLEYETELAGADKGIEKARHDMKEARREYDDVKARLERKKGSSPETVINVRGTTDGPAALVFEAFTPSAGWNVVYEMNLDSASGSVGTKMNAVAWQHTGVDVDGEVTFNTRAPVNAVRPPDVRPLTVGLTQNAPSLLYAGAPGAPMPTVAADSMEMSENRVAEKQAPRAISTLSNVSVAGSGKIDGDGSEVRVKLGEFELKCAPLIISIPEQSREAWIVASIDVIPESFLPGAAELSVDNASTGRTQIAESVASARIPFGMASRIVAKKKPYIRETGSSWIGTGILNDGYTLEVTNGMETEQEVTVMDRLPLPTVDKVTLEVKKIEPKQDERDKENKLSWKIKLQPGETKKITVEYAIKYPGDATLSYR